MKKALLFVLVLILAGCAGKQPSVCETIERSVICDMATNAGTTPELVGDVFFIANAVAIERGQYTAAEAVGVLADIRSRLNSPVSYVFIREVLFSELVDNPGLFSLATQYLTGFTSSSIMYKADQDMLISWIDRQIKTLEAMK